MRLVDLRSDTVTKPCSGMRQAMASAEVGDDVYDEDPTVNRLQVLAAEILGKESALFVSSGTMGNLIASMLHGRDRRSEIICGSESHVAREEVGGIAAVAGVHTHQVLNLPDGTLCPTKLRDAVLSDAADIHFSTPRAVFLENTHGMLGGRVLPLEYVSGVRVVCRQRTANYVALHCDGARLWNAATKLCVSPAVVARPFDSVTCCLSKGLGAPMGSVLAGDAGFIREAKWARKMLGGGMRQVGILAAAGVFALQKNLPRLADDHRRAAHFAGAMVEAARTDLPIGALKVDTPDTNIVFLRVRDVESRDRVISLCEAQGVKLGTWYGSTIRCVFHVNHTDDDALHVGCTLKTALLRTFT